MGPLCSRPGFVVQLVTGSRCKQDHVPFHTCPAPDKRFAAFALLDSLPGHCKCLPSRVKGWQVRVSAHARVHMGRRAGCFWYMYVLCQHPYAQCCFAGTLPAAYGGPGAFPMLTHLCVQLPFTCWLLVIPVELVRTALLTCFYHLPHCRYLDTNLGGSQGFTGTVSRLAGSACQHALCTSTPRLPLPQP